MDDDGDGNYKDLLNTALLLCPGLVAVLYYLGAAFLHTKVPIYILLSFQYAVLSFRFYKVRALPAPPSLSPLFNPSSPCPLVARWHAGMSTLTQAQYANVPCLTEHVYWI